MKPSNIFFILLILFTACSKKLKPQQLLIDVKELSSDKYKGRKTGTVENQQAATYIIKRFEEIGIKPFSPSYKQPFAIPNKNNPEMKGLNILGYIAGKSKEVIVISAHYDHLGVIKGRIYNGADDNASGVAALFSIAEYFIKNQPQHTLIFAAFDAEEMGLLGSRAFIANPSLPQNSIKLNINLDMVSRADNGILYAAGTSHYPEFKNYLKENKARNNIKLVLGHDKAGTGKEDWTNQSDHFAFHEKHIPFIYFGVDDHADYHKDTDDYPKIDKETFLNAVDIITHSVADIDKGMSLRKAFRDKLIMN